MGRKQEELIFEVIEQKKKEEGELWNLYLGLKLKRIIEEQDLMEEERRGRGIQKKSNTSKSGAYKILKEHKEGKGIKNLETALDELLLEREKERKR